MRKEKTNEAKPLFALACKACNDPEYPLFLLKAPFKRCKTYEGKQNQKFPSNELVFTVAPPKQSF